MIENKKTKQGDLDEKFKSIKASQKKSISLIIEDIEKLKKKVKKYEDLCKEKNIFIQYEDSEQNQQTVLDQYADKQIQSFREKEKTEKQQYQQQPPNNFPKQQQQEEVTASYKCNQCGNAYDAPYRLHQHVKFRHTQKTQQKQGV